MRLLEKLGFRNVSHYAGGIREWRRANLRFDTGRERSVRPEERAVRPEEGAAPPGV